MLSIKRYYWVLMLLVGCQGAKLPTAFFSPETTSYAKLAAVPDSAGPTSPRVLRLAQSLPPRIRLPRTGQGHFTRPSPSPDTPKVATRYPPGIEALILPDSLKNASSKVDRKADPATTVVNLLGAASLGVGAGLFIHRASAEPTRTEWGGLTDLMSLITPTIMVLTGIALLFFQGKNGRMRRLREERRLAERKK